ncbi:hypothetical protein [Pandoraea soli]
MTGRLPSGFLVHASVDRLNTLSERILALAMCSTTDAGKEIPLRFLLAIFEELGEMAGELVSECHKLKSSLLAA